MEQSLEQNTKPGGVLAPPETQSLSRNVFRTVLGAGLAISLAACTTRGEDRTQTGAGEPAFTTSEDTTSTEEQAPQAEQPEPASLTEVIPSLFSDTDLLGLAGAQPGDYIALKQAENREPTTYVPGETGIVSIFRFYIQNDDPNLPTDRVGLVQFTVTDLEALETLTTSVEGAPPSGLEPWGSIENEKNMWDAELFTYVDSAGNEYPAAATESWIRIDNNKYSLYMAIGRQDSYSPESAVNDPMFTGGQIAPHLQDMVNRVVAATFAEG